MESHGDGDQPSDRRWYLMMKLFHVFKTSFRFRKDTHQADAPQGLH